MTKILVAALVASTMTFAGGDIAPVAEVVQVQADSNDFYVGVAYSAVNSDTKVLGFTAYDQAKDAGTIVAGYNFNQYIALEGRYTVVSRTEWRDSDLAGGTYSLFVKPQYTFGNDIKVYALAGYGGVDTQSLYGTSSEDGFQYGAGLAYGITPSWEIFADYTVLLDDQNTGEFDANKLTASAVTAGINYKF